MNYRKIFSALTLTGILAISLISLSGCLNKKGTQEKSKTSPEKTKFDLKASETEYNAVMFGMEEISAEAGKLADQGKIAESKEKLAKLKDKIQKGTEITKHELDNVRKQEQIAFFEKRAEFLEYGYTVYDKWEECIDSLAVSQEAASDCMQQVVPMMREFQQKGQEVRSLEFKP